MILNSPTVTVVVPTYNRGKMLKKCIHSIVDNILDTPALLDRLQIIIVDDASTLPDAVDALTEIETELPQSLLKILRLQTNSGGAALPRNVAIDHLQSDYVFFVDSDDYLGNEAIGRLFQILDTHQPDYIYLNSVNDGKRSDASDGIDSEYEERDLLYALRSLVIRRVFRTEIIKKMGLRFDEYLKSGQDVLFAFQFMMNAKIFGFAGGYDYYHLVEHRGSDEDSHLSRKGNDLGFAPYVRASYFLHILQRCLIELAATDLPPDMKGKIASTVLLARFLRSIPPRLHRMVNLERRSGIFREAANVLHSPLFPADSIRLMKPDQQVLAGFILQRDLDSFLVKSRPKAG